MRVADKAKSGERLCHRHAAQNNEATYANYILPKFRA